MQTDKLVGSPPRPIYFLHIAKTGGTSLTAALKSYYRPEDVISDNGNLSVAFVRQYEHRLTEPVFLHGHPDHEVVTYLADRVRTITLLRRPMDHAISNYLHIASDPDNRFYAAAKHLGFSEFMLMYRYNAIYQATSLHVAISPKPTQRFAGDFLRNIGAVLDMMNKLFWVSTIEEASESSFLLSAILELPFALKLPRLNTSADRGATKEGIEKLRAEYVELRRNSDIAPLLALEEAVYTKAASMRSTYEQRVMDARWEANAQLQGASLQNAVYAGETGSIWLFGNWSAVVPTPDGPCWWTGKDDRSAIFLELSSQTRYLEIELFVESFAQNYAFFCKNILLDHRIENRDAARPVIVVDLAPLADVSRAIISLIVPRTSGAQVPPYYPALALGHFRLV